MERKYPENYRFSSDLKEYKKCVDISCEMMKNKQMFVLYGCINKVKFDILIDQEKFSNLYTDIEFQKFKEILIEEVSVIIEQNIKDPNMNEESLEEYLQEKEFSVEEAKYIAEEKYDKRRYTYNELMHEESISRYILKENTLSEKLSKFSYEINRYVFEDNSDMLYSVIEFASTENLDREGTLKELFYNNRSRKVKFVCDKYDLEYLINALEQIKERL